MGLGHEIEQVRIAREIPVFHMCDILNISSEKEYHDIVSGHIKLDLYQKIMLVSSTRHGYNTIK